MRIGMLLDKPFPPDPRVGNEMRSLHRAGHDVHLLCPSVEDGRPLSEDWQGIHVHRIRMSKKFFKRASALVLRVPFYWNAYERPLRELAERERFEAIHVHDLPLLRVGLRVGRALGVPVVSDLHENYPAAVATYDYANRWPGRWLISVDQWRRYERRAVPAADRVIVVVPEAMDRFQGLVPPERMVPISNTVDVDEFEGFPRDDSIEERFGSRFTIGYLGGFDRHRGLDTLVDGFAQVADEIPEAHLLLVGAGATKGPLEADVRARGLADRVSFEGWQDYRLFPSYVRACKVCTIPHRKSEHTDTTIPHKLFHYMLLERPVLASNCLPIARILEETEAGLVHASGDAAGVAAALRTLRDGELRARLGARGREAVLGRYNWDRTAETLIEIYATLQQNRT
ncbi:MAG: glycosyltransferase family 4 protein [Candidatus Eisenbacteria bacterium]